MNSGSCSGWEPGVSRFDLAEQVAGDGLVPVGTAQAGLTVGADDRDVVAIQPDHRGVECATAQVIHQDVPRPLAAGVSRSDR